MKFPRVVLPLLLVLLALTLSACGNATATQNFPGLLLQENTLYLSEGLHVYAIDVVSGQEVRLGDSPLRFPAESDGSLNLFAPVAMTTDGQMVIPNSHPSEHSLYSINPENGAINWAFQKSKGTWVGGALTLDETIYAPGGDGILYALDLRGNERWSVTVAESALMTHPVTDGQLIFQPSMDGFLHAFEPANGRETWRVELDGPVLAAPAVAEDGTLYIGTLGGNLYAIDAATGKINWQQQLEGTIWSTPALQAENLFIGTLIAREGKFYAIDRATGAIRWQRSEVSSIIASPLTGDDQVVYVTDAGRVQALSSDGSPLWQADLKGKLVSAPVQAGDLILVAPLQGDYLLVAFDTNGAQRWTFKP